MRLLHFVCMLTIPLSTLALEQSNPVPPINQSGRVASPISSPRSQVELKRELPLPGQFRPGGLPGRGPLMRMAPVPADPIFKVAPTYGSGGQHADSVVVGDVNGDGMLDLVVANSCADSTCTNGSVSVLLGNGDGTFKAAVSYGSGGYAASSVAVADVNGDGKQEMVVANT